METTRSEIRLKNGIAKVACAKLYDRKTPITAADAVSLRARD